MMQRLLRLVLLLAVHLPCHALSQSVTHSKVISRNSDGRYEIFPLGNLDNRVDDDTEKTRAVSVDSTQKIFHPTATLRRVRSTFLPANRLAILRSSGYLSYILYDNIQDLSTSLRSVLATQRILEGVGVGRAGATALSATLNFIIRDGCGMVASLLFTSYAAHSFRRNVKRWKYFADVMVDIGITLEIIAPSVLSYPMLSGYFLPLLCLGNVCKALCGVAAGACGGALQMHWAVKVMGTEEGISEVAAKNGAQRTLMGGVGLVLAAVVASWVGDVRNAIGLYCALTLVHLVANYRGLKLIELDWLNGWRMHLVVEEFLARVNGNTDKQSVRVSNPMEASKREPLLFLPELRSMKRQSTKFPILMGVSFNKLVQLAGRPSSSFLQSNLVEKRGRPKDNYILSVGHTASGKLSKARQCILVAFFSDSSNSDRAKAYLHGCLVRRALTSQSSDSRTDIETIQKAEETAKNEIEKLWPIFEKSVTSAGWKLDKTECSTEGYEIHLE
mmetsp:Transcript_1637/g.3254  ORF Transcript_1637/g.3254 Transcript_1637/m.3254 type:complete len:502 (+) Transcript_1637:82-1587(+)